MGARDAQFLGFGRAAVSMALSGLGFFQGFGIYDAWFSIWASACDAWFCVYDFMGGRTLAAATGKGPCHCCGWHRAPANIRCR